MQRPRGPCFFLSASIASASFNASGFTSITEFSCGPALSSALMRSRYRCVSAFEVSLPDCMAFCSSAMEASTTTSVTGCFAAGRFAAGFFAGGAAYTESLVFTATRAASIARACFIAGALSFLVHRVQGGADFVSMP